MAINEAKKFLFGTVFYCVFLAALLFTILWTLTYFFNPVLVLGFLSFAYWYSTKQITVTAKEAEQRKDLFVIIVGAGFSGICAAIKLKQQKIKYLIIEKSSNIGGTWWHNKYPGCACDIFSNLYSYSFHPNPHWSSSYPTQPEILNYLEDVFQFYGLYKDIKLNSKVDRCVFDSNSHTWTVNTSTGEALSCNYLISAVGSLHVPKYPDISGQNTFSGESVHTALWREDFEYANKTVGIIGTGCSGVQTAPIIAEKAKHLYLFQRTPCWLVPQARFPHPKFVQKIFEYVPSIMKLYRWRIFSLVEQYYLVTRRGSFLATQAQKELAKLMRNEIKNEDMQKKLVPTYEFGCKRVIPTNAYLPMYKRQNVSLIDAPIREITEAGITVGKDSNLSNIALDAIIYATGFDVQKSFSGVDAYRPCDSKRLADVWGNTPNAYLGIMCPGFPNMFMLLGPNTVLAHNSVVWMIECQVNYVIKAITAANKRGWKSLEVTKEAHDDYQKFLKRKMSEKVFGVSGCVSWYVNSEGHNYALWPSSCVHYWWKTLKINFDHFITR